MALIINRPIADEEYPARIGDVVSSAWAISARGGLEPLPAGLRSWLTRALQLDARHSFQSVVEAQDDLERVLGESDYLATPATLQAFLDKYHEAVGPAVMPDAMAAPAPPASTPVAVQPPPLPRAATPGPTPSRVAVPASAPPTPAFGDTPAPPVPVAVQAPAPPPKAVVHTAAPPAAMPFAPPPSVRKEHVVPPAIEQTPARRIPPSTGKGGNRWQLAAG